MPPTRRDPKLADALAEEFQGIMRWIIDGTLGYGRIGLAPPLAVTSAIAEYFADENLFGQWEDQVMQHDRQDPMV